MSSKKYLSKIDESSEQDDLTAEIEASNEAEYSPNTLTAQEHAWEARMEQMDKVSSVMGSLLLSGWTMEKEICEKCNSPLFSQKSGPMKCPQCQIMPDKNTNKNNNNNNNENPKNIETKMDKNDKITDNNFNDDDYWGFTKTEKNKFNQIDTASELIGKMLLQGWTMLAIHCNKCKTPKMNFKGKNEICPYCNEKNNENNVVKKVMGNGIHLKKEINKKMNEIRNNNDIDNDRDNIWDNYAKNNKNNVIKLDNNENNVKKIKEVEYKQPQIPKNIQQQMQNNYNQSQSNIGYMQTPQMQYPYNYNQFGMNMNNNNNNNNGKMVRFNDYGIHLWLNTSMENTVKHLLSKIDKINETGKNIKDLKYYLECLNNCVNIKSNIN